MRDNFTITAGFLVLMLISILLIPVCGEKIFSSKISTEPPSVDGGVLSSSVKLSKIKISFSDNLSASVQGLIVRIVHSKDLSYVQGVLGAPLIPEFIHYGEVIMKKSSFGLTGTYRMTIIPNMPPKKAEDALKYLLNKSVYNAISVHSLMTFFLNEGYVITNIRFGLTKVKKGNSSMPALVISADVRSSNPYISLYNLTFRTDTIKELKLVSIAYTLEERTTSMEKLVLGREGGKSLSLAPILITLPKDVVGIVDVELPPNCRITGGQPTPKEILWSEGRWQYISNLAEKKDIEVYFSEVKPMPNLIAVWILALIPPALILLLILSKRDKICKKSRKS